MKNKLQWFAITLVISKKHETIDAILLSLIDRNDKDLCLKFYCGYLRSL